MDKIEKELMSLKGGEDFVTFKFLKGNRGMGSVKGNRVLILHAGDLA